MRYIRHWLEVLHVEFFSFFSFFVYVPELVMAKTVKRLALPASLALPEVEDLWHHRRRQDSATGLTRDLGSKRAEHSTRLQSIARMRMAPRAFMVHFSFQSRPDGADHSPGGGSVDSLSRGLYKRQ